MNTIEIRNLTKNFGQKQALKGLNMTVPAGAIYGFIGEKIHNGKDYLRADSSKRRNGETVWQRLYGCRCKSKNRRTD